MAMFLEVMNISTIYTFFKDFTVNGKKTNTVAVFRSRTLPNILKHRDHRRNFPIIWEATFLQTNMKKD